VLSGLSGFYAYKALAVFAAIAAIVVRGRRAYHPFARFGPANYVTVVRALLVACVAAFVGERPTAAVAATAVAAASVVTVLDGVDGWLARTTRMASAFGARFDMEVDALLIMALSVLTWRHGKAGIWVLASGLLRYAFVAAGRVWPWLREPLFPSFRRKAICVVQIAGLLIALAPVVERPWSAIAAAIALVALAYSFLVDTLWLSRDRPRDAIKMLAGLAVLNASLTFVNLWPTPAIYWAGAVSIELAVCVLALAALCVWRRRPGRAALEWLSAAWLLLVIGRYAEVTAPALYGRDINLYWDLRFIPDVVAMVTRVAPAWLIAAAAAAVVLVLLLVQRVIRWSFAWVIDGLEDPVQRRALTAACGMVIALFAVHDRRPLEPGADARFTLFTAPVVETYARQAQLVVRARYQAKALPDSPPFDSTFADVAGADVFLVFVESYGAVSEQPRFAQGLAASRTRLAADIRDSHREVVSAFVESPTFGGSSWLAHLSLISGIEVRDPDTNALLMTQPRDTLVKAFGRHGYRTIGLMPGLRQQWPEGRFYGFQDIYGADRLAYAGPEFGWFAVPDQFSLARFDELERDQPAQPRFVFFPTISTHFPFQPTPPYQPDWPRMLTAKPYDGPDIVRAYAHEPNWTDFAPGYIDALSYDFAVAGGYLRRHADRDLVMVLVGDHQPPAAVSGEGASWNVPIHIVTSRAAVLDRLVARGFRHGLQPSGPAVSKMHELLRIFLDAFGPLDS
jgi:phosphatidylglycerophosphate synthase